MPSLPHRIAQTKPDLLIVGGGIVGLWAAYAAAKAGLRATLVEKRKLASGASGGMLGALMPHHPAGWSAKKQFQLDGLLSLPDRIALLEAETGMDCGYGRVGRLQPIAHPEKRRQSTAWEAGSKAHWPTGLDWAVKDTPPDANWVAPSLGRYGWNTDTLSARINPRALCTALIKTIQDSPGVSIVEDTPIITLDAIDPACPIILAAGVGSFGLVAPDCPSRIGIGIKGQGAKLKPARPIDPALPIIYADSTYVIGHADGTVAVGSTSEKDFDSPDTPDDKLEAVIDHARMICPALARAQVVERWAGLRPKAGKPDPLLGPLPARPKTIVATGGFKITFAIAHLMADAALALVSGNTANIPDAFLPENRI